MYEFDHPNVLKLSGVCLNGGPAPFIIMPFMENGSLLAHLKEQRQNIELTPENTDPEEVVSVRAVHQIHNNNTSGITLMVMLHLGFYSKETVRYVLTSG